MSAAADIKVTGAKLGMPEVGRCVSGLGGG